MVLVWGSKEIQPERFGRLPNGVSCTFQLHTSQAKVRLGPNAAPVILSQHDGG